MYDVYEHVGQGYFQRLVYFSYSPANTKAELWLGAICAGCGIKVRQQLLVAGQPFAHPVLKLHVSCVDANAVQAPVGKVTVIRSSSCDPKKTSSFRIPTHAPTD